jgi:acetolactate synthase-1/3 small subunit
MAELWPHHTLSVLVENKAGVLARVANLFARRGVQHLLARGGAHRRRALQPHHVVVDVESAPLEQIVKQLNKLINVVKITELDPRRTPSSAS